ncbi:calcium/calmodulin-dependent protein kinase-like protein [Naegleria gruberi]|uniref:Calcium/calmodulin-dependent protein kinase-like protein n=1 Tax=Naegleria gruberi TaxID=5762 RepID=D2VZN1_NAEGR|nr:calcium/calmodulin-dependent protein kinase-like protein [Naegleria gruberi]EFC37690.1 calcium/calmodulin-dependent protein kinase-like protein [Naegleria gruberi]|eukprot:XP_002670434.1 calcium/calmodulin-dependent protein kinase-like protein [Naegleria gruberi strain NEG-M]
MADENHFFTDAKTHDIKKDLEFGKVLGSGTFSIVREAAQKNDGRKVAVKIIDKTNLEVNKDSLKTEVSILKSVNDQNIVELIDVYENGMKVYLVMELLTGGELFDRIVNKYPEGYSEDVAAELIRKIVSSIKYLHSCGVVHRDLKPENLIYSSDGNDSDIKITDFGLAKIADGDFLLKTACGTPNYVAPEVLQNTGYDASVDMWSIGVILYILLCGFPPFYSENTPELFEQIINGDYDFPSPYWDKVSDSAKDLIRHLLVVNPKKRFTPDQTLSHPWIKKLSTNKNHRPEIIDELRKFNARRKFKITVEAVLAAQKLLGKLKNRKSSIKKH